MLICDSVYVLHEISQAKEIRKLTVKSLLPIGPEEFIPSR